MRSSALHHLLTAALCLAVVLPSVAAEARVKLTSQETVRVRGNLDSGYRSGDFGIRSASVRALGYADMSFAKSILLDALEDPQWQVQREAITSLLRQGSSAWEDALAKAIRNPTLNAREEVLSLLEPLGMERGLKFLAKTLDDPKFPGPDRYVEALVSVGGPWMARGFELGLGLKKNKDARDAFAAELGKLPLPAAAPLYRKVIKKASSAAQKAIVAQMASYDGEVEVGFLRGLLKSRDAAIRLQAAAVLAARGDRSGEKILTKTVGGGDRDTQLRALQGLLGIASERHFDLIKPLALGDGTDRETLRAVYAIYAQVGNPKLAKHLSRRVAGSYDIDRRAAAARYLGAVVGKPALEQLYGILRDAGPDVIRLEAARSVGDVKFRESIKVLEERLHVEPNRDVRVALIGALGKIRDRSCIPVLQSQVAMGDPMIQKATVEALAAIHHDETLPLLESFLWNPNTDIRRAALAAVMDLGPQRHMKLFKRAMGWMKGDDFVNLVKAHGSDVAPHIKLALKNSRDAVRRGAMAAVPLLNDRLRLEIAEDLVRSARRVDMRLGAFEELLDLQGKKASSLALELAASGDIEIRVAAVRALAKLKPRGVRGILFNLADDRDERVRVAAAEALLRL